MSRKGRPPKSECECGTKLTPDNTVPVPGSGNNKCCRPCAEKQKIRENIDETTGHGKKVVWSTWDLERL